MVLLASQSFLSAGKAQTLYSITDLGTLGGSSAATELNARGAVIGFSRIPNDFGVDIAFLDRHREMQKITLGTDVSIANDLNDRGQVVGEYSVNEDFLPEHAFLYSDGRFHDLLPGVEDSSAAGINDRGEIVGAFSGTPGNPNIQHAFLYRFGKAQDLGTLGGDGSFAEGINNRGEVVGASLTAGNSVYHAFLYECGHMRDLGGFVSDSPSKMSVAFRINEHGQVVGYAYLANSTVVFHAFLYSGDEMRDLGALGPNESSEADDINDRSEAVGSSFDPNSGVSHAFLYAAGQMQDLNKLLTPNQGWIVTNAAGINDAGQIAGTGRLNGELHALLLTPVNRWWRQPIAFTARESN
jgi:probable HAF family extracellular repeat protein